ncbi:hypothetical protein PPNSA23_41810 [Phyllobacterium phragmitis]|uniref:Uncharacterized protein n=1 Tax=Phyllobacterium phragmitis TaxID=2670329 RepID=A0ABQ0H5M3_9HYPH
MLYEENLMPTLADRIGELALKNKWRCLIVGVSDNCDHSARIIDDTVHMHERIIGITHTCRVIAWLQLFSISPAQHIRTFEQAVCSRG